MIQPQYVISIDLGDVTKESNVFISIRQNALIIAVMGVKNVVEGLDNANCFTLFCLAIN